MPNWSYNSLTVAGTPEDLRSFKHAVCAAEPNAKTEKRAVLDFGRLVPMPPELLEDKGEPANGRLPAWYEWAVDNWGTKWNAWWPRLSGTLKSGVLSYRFDTAWSPPHEWLDQVAPMFPSLTFHLVYEEELDHFHGEAIWDGGEPILAQAYGVWT
jgi:hypothetical protein